MQKFSEDKKEKRTSSFWGEVAVWVVTFAFLAIMATFVAILANSNKNNTVFGRIEAQDSRYGSLSSAKFVAEKNCVLRGKEVVWQVDGEEVSRFICNGEEIVLDTSALKVGTHKIVLIADGAVVAETFVKKNKPLLVVQLPNLCVEYGDTVDEILACTFGWVDGDTAESVGFDCKVDWNGCEKTQVGVYPLTYEDWESDKYDVEIINGSLTVCPKQVFFAPCQVAKVYDGDTFAKSDLLCLEGVLEGDVVGVNAVLEYCDKNVGEKKQVKVAQCTLFGLDAKNYTVNYFDAEFWGSIIPMTLKLEGVKAMDKVYDGTTAVNFYNGGTLNGVLAEDKVFVGTLNGRFEDAEKGLDKKVVIESVTLVGVDSQNYLVLPTVTFADIVGKNLSAVPSN